MVKTISVFDLVGRGYSNDDGLIIKQAIVNEFEKGNKVIVNFLNVDGVTSSFVNTAFIELLNEFSFDFIRKHLNFSDSRKQINNMIKDRFSFEVTRRKNLINC